MAEAKMRNNNALGIGIAGVVLGATAATILMQDDNKKILKKTTKHVSHRIKKFMDDAREHTGDMADKVADKAQDVAKMTSSTSASKNGNGQHAQDTKHESTHAGATKKSSS